MRCSRRQSAHSMRRQMSRPQLAWRLTFPEAPGCGWRAIFCGAALFASSIAYAADTVSDKEMADRYSQAAQSGDSDAQFYLAALYSAGVGRPRSDAEAFRWFSRAADQGPPLLRLPPTASHATASRRRPWLLRNHRPRPPPAVPPIPALRKGRASLATRRTTSTRYWIAYLPDCASGSVFEIEEKPMSSRGLVWSGSVLAVLAAAVGGAYLMYPDYFQPPTVTTGVATLGPVSEAVYGTGTVEPERWAKVVPLQRRRLVEL